MRLTCSLPFLVALCGCVPELDSHPVGDHALALFSSFDQDPDALPGHLAALDTELAGLDYEGSYKDRLFDLPELDAAAFAGITVADGIDTGDQMRMSLAGRSPHAIQSHIALQVERDQTCVNAESVVCHAREPDAGEDAACFVDGTCDRYNTLNTLRIESVLDFWVQSPASLRRVTLDDGRTAMIIRSWIREPFENDNGKRSWRQRFGLDVFIEDPDDASTTRRFYATWLGPSVNGIPGVYLQRALRRGLREGFTNPDTQIEDGSCEISLDTCLEDSPF